MSSKDNKSLVELAKKKRQIHLLGKLQKGKVLSLSELKELEDFECGPLRPGCVKSRMEVAKAFHVTKRTVEYWVEKGMPREPEGYYNLIEIHVWRALRNEKDKTPAEQEKIKWDIKYREYRALLYKLEYKKACGELISLAEVEAGRIARILAVKSALLALGRVVAPAIGGMEPREIQVYIDERVKEICRQFAGEDIDEDEEEKTAG